MAPPVISATVTNEARLNWTSTTSSSRVGLDNFGGAQPVAPGALLPPSVGVDSSKLLINLSGGTGTLLAFGPSAVNSQRQANLLDDVSIAKAKHVFKFGLDVRVLRPIVGQPAFSEQANFTSVGDPTKAAGQETPGTFLSGIASSGNVATRPLNTGMQFLNYSSYAQDTWRLTARLTATYGIRWDIAPPPTGTNHPLFALTDVQSLSTLAFAPAGTPLWTTDYKNIAPRLGIAYHLRDSKDFGLVLRVGAGIFHDLISGFLGSQPSSPPNVSTRTFVNTPFPLSSAVAAPPTLPGSPPYASAVGLDPKISAARTYQWNAALEQQIGRHGTVSATYVGAVGRDLARATTLNNPSPTFTSVILEQSNASSDYHSLQVQYRGNVVRRIQTLASYSWSHSIDTASADVTGPVPSNRINPNSDRGSSDFDVRHAFSTALSISAPQVSGTWWSPLVRDWAIDTIFQTRTAFPFDVTVGRDLGYGSYLYRPDLVPGQPEYVDDPHVGGGRRLDNTRAPGIPNQVGAFLIPTALRQGTLGRNATRGFGMYQADLDLRREFRLRERVRLQAKVEAFNVLNHPNFADPSGTIGVLSPAGVLTPLAAFGRSASMLGTQLGSGGANGGLSPLYQIGGPRSVQLSLKLIF